ncbi:MAG: flagellar motor protein MotB [Armatimonadota bacterium]|nr:flagellar motor protein MotB [Armatimonadota bacterium]MDW8142926.1 flagellar motor protein MotB [Armatimonadota bacterium]
MAAMTKRKHGGGEGGGGHETAGMMRWLVTYADMITLLLALFIMLYAISTLDIQRFKALVEEFQALFSGGGTAVMTGGRGMLRLGAPESQKPLVVPLLPGKKPEMHDEEETLERFVEQKKLEGKILIHREERGLVVSMLTDGIFFERGSAELSEEAKNVLRQIAPILKRSGRFIRVEGHTCDLPIHTMRYPSNWELSVARATNVVRYLILCGVPANRLSAVGYGEFRPMFQNTNEENRRLNRRVDIVLLSESAKKAEPIYPPKGVKIQ